MLSETGDVLGELAPHGGRTLALACSRDGRMLATAGTDRSIRVWDARDHTLRQTLRDCRKNSRRYRFRAANPYFADRRVCQELDILDP